jgi:hypothetical protein
LALTDRNFDFADSALQAHKVLLELGLFVLQNADLVLQFHVLLLLAREVVLQIFVHSKNQRR